MDEDLTFLTFCHTEIAKMWAMWDGLVVTPNVFINGIFVPYTHKKQKTRPGSLFKWEAWRILLLQKYE